MKKILVVNLGSTSSKVAYHENDRCVLNENIEHDAAELRAAGSIPNQVEYRNRVLTAFLDRHGIAPSALDAVISRGGHTKPIEGGVYRINSAMLEQSRSHKYGYHACDLGLEFAAKLSEQGPVPLTLDPPVTCEFQELAFYSGLPEIRRRSAFHVLNQRGAGRKYAEDIGRPYEELRLVVIHMGGGVSVAAHEYGRLIDANNALDGDGPFSTNRTGGLPVGSLVDICFAGEHDRQAMRRKINGDGGLFAYIGETDLRKIEERIRNGDNEAKLALDAMCYQIAKEVGAYATVLKGKVDAILFTGGMSNSGYVTDLIAESVSFIAPIVKYPGEFEMQALARGAYDALCGRREIREFSA